MSTYSPSEKQAKAREITHENVLAAKAIFQEIILTSCRCTCGIRTMELYVLRIFELLGDNGTLWPDEVGFSKFDLLAYDYFKKNNEE